MNEALGKLPLRITSVAAFRRKGLARKAAARLRAAGLEVMVRDDLKDNCLPDAMFLEAWRPLAPGADRYAAAAAILDEVKAIIEPLDGFTDEGTIEDGFYDFNGVFN
jgi:hypothetical protein